MATLVAEGKTKRVERVGGTMQGMARIFNLDDTTAGDGARHEVISGKAELSTRTNANTAKLLQACGFPVAYGWQLDATSFIAPELEMIKLEVVTRGIAWGSYLERNPKTKQGQSLDPPIVEFFLKTKNRHWSTPRGEYTLICDDPLMEITEHSVFLHDAHARYVRGGYFTHLTHAEAFPIAGTKEVLSVMTALNRAVYETLRFAWSRVGADAGVEVTFPDMKLEYGFTAVGQLMIGDVIDAESCRLLVDGEHASKQGFREGASAELTKIQLGRAADLSDRFHDVMPEVVKWTRERFEMRSVPAYPGLRY